MSTEDRRQGRGGQVGTLFLATVLGVGVGLLAAPSPGDDTRRALRKRLAAAREDIGEGLEDLEERSRPARRAVREGAEKLRRSGKKKYDQAVEELEDFADDMEDGDDESGSLGTVLAVGAGVAVAAFLLSSERAGPTRERVREAAATVRDEVESRWDRFQRRRREGEAKGEGNSRTDPADSAPQVS